MALEIERKFLVKDERFLSEVVSSSRIVQGYLCSGSGKTVRVRIRADKGYLTIKGPGGVAGLSRFEWEKEISVSEAEELLALADPGMIDKVRHLVPNTDGIHTWEVDVFHGENEGLVVAEIELGSEDDTFDRPEWLDREVTGDRRFYNSSLIKNPFSNWR